MARKKLAAAEPNPLDVAEMMLVANNAMADPANWPGANVEMRELAALKPSPHNPRRHTDEQVRQVAGSLNDFGWTLPLLIDAEGEIIAGEAVWKAAQLLGRTHGPCCVATDWPPEKVRAYRLADNKLAENSAWDDEALKAELQALMGFGIDAGSLGFSPDDLDALFGDPEKEGLTHPDEVPGLGEKPVSRPGDVWVLGDHRVTCGSALVAADVGRVMAGHLADAVWTDPPYNVDYEGTAGKIANDKQTAPAFREFLTGAFRCALDVLKQGGPAYVAHADTEGLAFRASLLDAGFKLSGCLIWRKDSLVLGRSDYQWQHEPILYGWKPGARHRWFGGRRQTTIMELGEQFVTDNGDGTLTIRLGEDLAVIRGTDLKLERVEPTVISLPKPKRSKEHPTMKPVELVSRMLRNSTRKGDVVLDPFGGSGSTLIACQMLSRFARLVELDARYVDVIVRRWQTFTGEIAYLESTGRSFELVEQDNGDAGNAPEANPPEAD